MRKPIIRDTNLIEYFRDQVQLAISNQHLETSEMAEFYIVNLLRDFRRSERLFDEESGKKMIKPLAELLHEAIEGDSTVRMKNLKKIGDIALYTAGFFPETFKRKIVGHDYFISMGETAYTSLSDILSGEKTFGELYGELASKFAALVSVLMEVAAGDKTNSNLLRLYEQWMATGDTRLEDLLRRQGLSLSALPAGGKLQ